MKDFLNNPLVARILATLAGVGCFAVAHFVPEYRAEIAVAGGILIGAVNMTKPGDAKAL